jgi:hypothetical protein
MIGMANDFYRTDRRSMARNHGWLPSSGDASWGRFPSATVDKQPNKARDAVMPTIIF